MKHIFMVEEKEPYWPEWCVLRYIPYISMGDDEKARTVECCKIESISKSADFRVVEYLRVEPKLTFREILDAEGFTDWEIRISTDAYCWCGRKRIDLPENATMALFLHELAHAIYQQPEGEFNNHYHGGNWASTYGMLVDKYMVCK